MLLASMFVAARLFQFSFNLLLVFTTAFICTFCFLYIAVPVPFAVISLALTTSEFTDASASLRNSCNVKLFVVLDPTKKRLSLTTVVALILNRSFPLTENASPVLYP